MTINYEIKVKGYCEWNASNICTFAFSDNGTRLYGSGNGGGSNTIFIVDIPAKKTLCNSNSKSFSYIFFFFFFLLFLILKILVNIIFNSLYSLITLVYFKIKNNFLFYSILVKKELLPIIFKVN